VNRPLLLGHRGCRLPGFKENTLKAFEHAIDAGCDGIEFDVRYTKDGAAVLGHDPSWNRRSIASKRYRDLVAANGDRPVRLEDVLREFGNRAFLDIELKVAGNEAGVVAALQATPPRQGFMVSSFLPDVLMRVRNNTETIPLGFIFDRKGALDHAWNLPVRALLPRYELVDKELIEKAHEHRLQTMTWTVNDPDTIHRLGGWGIDGIISDDPALLYQTFHSG
jgi:glycerophosphoryl diester phosphodiesterase